jgi:hypothetical protein
MPPVCDGRGFPTALDVVQGCSAGTPRVKGPRATASNASAACCGRRIKCAERGAAEARMARRQMVSATDARQGPGGRVRASECRVQTWARHVAAKADSRCWVGRASRANRPSAARDDSSDRASAYRRRRRRRRDRERPTSRRQRRSCADTFQWRGAVILTGPGHHPNHGRLAVKVLSSSCPRG